MNYTNLNQNISIYFNEIRHFSSLTKSDEVTLFNRISSGDRSAEMEVFNKMAKLAVAIAKLYTSKAELLEDLIQEANMGILEAIHKYDLSMGYRFSSYARWWVKAFITNFLNHMKAVSVTNTRIPYLAKKIREEFYKKNHRDITEYELCDRLEEMGEVVLDTRVITDIMLTRLDKDVDEDGNAVVDCGEVAMTTSSRNDYEKEIENEALTNEVERRLARLTTREQELVRMRFGFTTGDQMDYASITERYNEGKEKYIIAEDGTTKKNKDYLTQERVRQLVEGALKKMK